MTTLWNPSKPLRQPPSYGRTTVAQYEPLSNVAERQAGYALQHTESDRRNRASATPFDKGTKGRT